MGSAVASDGEPLFQDVGEMRRRVKSEGDGREVGGEGGDGRVGCDSGVRDGGESQIRIERAMLSGQDSSGGGGDKSEGRIQS